jgi:hypothetical protein
MSILCAFADHSCQKNVSFRHELRKSGSVHRQGLYKISLWWPKLQGANLATQVQAEIEKPAGPAMAKDLFDQTLRHGQWNDIGQPFTFTVPATGAQVTVRIRRASSKPG